jgi:hypothetical protein
MSGVPAAQRVFWRSDSCTIWVGYDGDKLVFNGDDRQFLDGYEYSITVAPDQFDKLRRALAADGAVDVVDEVCAHADEMMARGERSWLDDHGIEHGFSCY